MKQDLPFWLSWAQQLGSPILELGCGTGRVLLPLAEAGHSVFGLDHDPGMLNFLQERIPEAVKKRVILIRGDMRNYCVSGRFPLIIMPCNTYSSLSISDRRTVLNRVRLHLQPKGVFILSMPNPRLLSELPVEGDPQEEISFFHPVTSYPVQVSSQWEIDREGVRFQWHYDHLHPDGRIERKTISSLHYFQGFDQIVHDIVEAGLEVIHTWGNFDRTSYTPESPNLIIAVRG
jgi:SAM-dependent methyltransferase